MFPLSFVLFGLLLVFGPEVYGADSTYTFEGFTLKVQDKSSGLSKDQIKKLVDTFKTVYPKEVKEYNKNAPKTVTIILDPTMNKAPAYTSGSTITVSVKYAKEHPKDLDLITHEAMHVVQAIKSNQPGWLVEGIADYVRHKFGVANTASGWSLPTYSSNQKYTDAYRVTAAFLNFVEKKKPGTVKVLVNVMRDNTYSASTWKKQTGSTVDQLWSQYAKSAGRRKRSIFSN